MMNSRFRGWLKRPARPATVRQTPLRLLIEELESRLVPFASPSGIHDSFTTLGLPFLTAATTNDINAQHMFQDVSHAFDSEKHFDNCRFNEAALSINNYLGEALA